MNIIGDFKSTDARYLMRIECPEQKALIDFILIQHPDKLTEKEKVRLLRMMAAYVGLDISFENESTKEDT